MDKLPISGAECDSFIDFYADLCTPYCVELFDPARISSSEVSKLNHQIRPRLTPYAIATRRSDHQAIDLRATDSFRARINLDAGAYIKASSLHNASVNMDALNFWLIIQLPHLSFLKEGRC